MQYTSNYNLMLPEGTDTVNLLTQMNPNTSDIDAALFANKQAVVGRATELTAGTVHSITRSNTDSPVFAFTATSNWTAGDTMTVDGTAVSVYLADGTTPASGAYIINTEVLAILNGSRVTLIGGGSGANAASDVSYDNTASGLTAADVQDAIDELAGKDIEVVWTNNDITANFIGQQVLITTNKQHFIVRAGTQGGLAQDNKIIKAGEGLHLQSTAWGSGRAILDDRPVTTAYSAGVLTLTFGDCERYDYATYGTPATGTVVNNRMIPYEILAF